jgi:ABC-type thiamine transport system ATPase subunit
LPARKRLPRELSGGERQRVALARVGARPAGASARRAFASLGPALRNDMLDLVAGPHAERRMTVLFVTHQPEDARRIGKTWYSGQGMVAATGAASDFLPGLDLKPSGAISARVRQHSITRCCPEADIIMVKPAQARWAWLPWSN